ncbi:lysine-N-methylase [Lachnospiraceae bacterium KM106-2]|nr:lysine-N-methylase [Lachnospiraceae bacterium KM106-2]
MILRIPDYYKEFHCIASKCKHCCCFSWEIDVDDQTYAYYRKVDGEFGERLRKGIRKEKRTFFRMYHGRCPFLTTDHLCEVYQTLGEEAMCEVCTEFPRFENDYGNVEEKILTLSCEEVGRILFTKKTKIEFIKVEQPEDEIAATAEENSTYQDQDGEMEAARDYCIDLLQNRKYSLTKRVSHFLSFCKEVQDYIDQNNTKKIEKIIQKDSIPSDQSKEIDITRVHKLFQKRMDLFAEMEVMDEEWEEECNNVMRAFHSDSHRGLYEQTATEFAKTYKDREYEYEHLMVYFVYRYLIKAVFDGRFLDRAKFCVICYLTIREMDRMRFLINGSVYTLEDRIETARIFSKEVEHSRMSLEYLSKKIKTEDVFGTDALMEQLAI